MNVHTVQTGWRTIRKYSVDLLTNPPPSDILSDVPSEIVTKKRIQYGNCKDATIGIFMEYCRNSTVHGVRYLGARKRSPLERIFWIIVFIISINLCVKLTLNIYNKWNDTPVIVSFAERTTSVWEIPFPTIVICSETKTRTNKFNFTEAFIYFLNNRSDDFQSTNLTANDTEKFQSLLHVCNLNVLSQLDPKNENIKALYDNDDVDVIKNLQMIVPTMNESTPFCKFTNQISFCETIFTPVISDDGICYQFNGLSERNIYRDEKMIPLTNNDENFYNTNDTSELLKTEWSVETGYLESTKTNVYPRRVLTSGVMGGMFFAVQGYDYDLEYICRDSVQGFKIYLQSPDEPSQVAKHFIRVPYGHEIQISIKPNLLTTSKNLRKYSPQRRQCFFNGEKYLRFFRIYNQNNCNFECLVNKTISNCGCVKFSMPRPPGIRVCGLADIKCYQNVEDNFLREEFEHPLQSINRNVRAKTSCNCLPACATLTYDFEISQTKFNIKELLEAHRDTYGEENPGLLMSRVSIFFKQKQFQTVKRSELYGTTDFMANCGGIFSLFMGVSLNSAIELIYFCSARLISNCLMRKKKKNQLQNFPENYFEVNISQSLDGSQNKNEKIL